VSLGLACWCAALCLLLVFKTVYPHTVVYLWLTNITRMTHLEGISLSIILKLKWVIYCIIKILKINLTLLLHAGCRHRIVTHSVLRKKKKSYFVRRLVLVLCNVQYLHLSKRRGNLLRNEHLNCLN